MYIYIVTTQFTLQSDMPWRAELTAHLSKQEGEANEGQYCGERQGQEEKEARDER